MKKLTKRKMYQKRRKKEKQERRKNSQQLEKQTTSIPTANDCNKTRKYHQQRKHRNDATQQYQRSLRQWWQTYYTALEFHQEQRRQWEETTVSVVQPTNIELLEKYAAEYETSSEEEEDDEEYNETTPEQEASQDEGNHTLQTEDEIDMEYLKFLEITHKHREEMRLKREEC